MRFSSLLDKTAMNYESSVEFLSETTPGVTFRVKRITFGRRLELTRRVREIARRIEFADAGAGFTDKVEASLLSMEVDRLYLEWGLESITGLTLDGVPASVVETIERGPEELCREMVEAIRRECGLTEEERKN